MATSTTAIGALRVGLGRACGSSSQQGRSFLASSRLPAIDGGPRAPHLSPTRTQSLVPSSTSRSFVTTTGGTFCDRDVSSRHFSSAAATSTTSTTALPDGSDIRILPNGVKQLKKLLEKDPDRSLRLTVNSGGCSGYQYEFKMEKTRQPDDMYYNSCFKIGRTSVKDLLHTHSTSINVVKDHCPRQHSRTRSFDVPFSSPLTAKASAFHSAAASAADIKAPPSISLGTSYGGGGAPSGVGSSSSSLPGPSSTTASGLSSSSTSSRSDGSTTGGSSSSSMGGSSTGGEGRQPGTGSGPDSATPEPPPETFFDVYLKSLLVFTFVYDMILKD
ncbi:unnamed protein product [Amoebophrya sp. A25]|nr:unnamed protein product [Amoebophrya sp. A25]|eukprot:GSA25T00010321001.1